LPGVYIHIPFCRQACTYCDFHFSTVLKDKTQVLQAIQAELELRHSYLNTPNIDSIYFGGGTPSLLSIGEIVELLNNLYKFFSIPQNVEVTIENNPEDISKDTLKEWKNAGINRLSIGLQSFMDEELKWMNRTHTAEQSITSVKMAQDSGFNNITIDLIYGSKFQNMETWFNTLQKAIQLNTQHISSYNLTIEKKTVLGTLFQKGKEPAVNDELSENMFLLMIKELQNAGFIHYEISNFGKPGYFAKHNSNYWLQQSYLGLGPSAHSFNGHSRQWNVSNNHAYVKAIRSGQPFFEKEELSLKDRFNEYVLTRLRTIWGCKIDEMRNLFGNDLTEYFIQGMSEKKDLVLLKENTYTLNEKGKLQADGIASDLFVL
jgi:oxygen-independent coproporphyrinogen III oxidase